MLVCAPDFVFFESFFGFFFAFGELLVLLGVSAFNFLTFRLCIQSGVVRLLLTFESSSCIGVLLENTIFGNFRDFLLGIIYLASWIFLALFFVVGDELVVVERSFQRF